MHDIHVAEKILQTILAYAREHKLVKINLALIELGQIEEHGQIIVSENLAFNIAMLAKGTIAQDLKVEIKTRKCDNYWRLLEIDGE